MTVWPLVCCGGASCGAGLLFVRKKNQAKLAREARERLAREQQERKQRELQLKREEERRAEREKQDAGASAAKEGMEAAKREVLGKFDAIAREGKAGKSEFKEVMATFLKDVIKLVPLEQGLKMAVEAGGARFGVTGYTRAECINLVTPLLKDLQSDVAHILDYDKIAILFFDLVDSNRDGSVERQELEAAVNEALALEFGAKLGAFIFRLVDRNQDGKIDLGEIQELISAVLQFADFIANFLFDIATRLADSPSMESFLVNKLHTAMPGDVPRSMVEGNFELRLMVAKQGTFNSPPQIAPQIRHAIAVVKSIYQGAQAIGGGTMTGALLSGMEWLQGGIDLDTFTRSLAPTIEKGILTKPEKSAIEATISGSMADPKVKQLVTQSLDSHWAMIEKALTSAQVEASKAVPELCRALFQLLDVDGDGRISQREIAVLKDLASGVAVVFSNVVVCAVGDGDSLTEAERLELQALSPDAFKDGVFAFDPVAIVKAQGAIMLGLFDMMDKNDDKVMSEEETAAFGIKIAHVCIQILRCLWEGFIAAAPAIKDDALPKLWQMGNITEFDQDTLPRIQATLLGLIHAAVLR